MRNYLKGLLGFLVLTGFALTTQSTSAALFCGGDAPHNYGHLCLSSANSCGMRNIGFIKCNGTCSADTPNNPHYYGKECRRKSAPNVCGDTAVTYGTKNCLDICDAEKPKKPKPADTNENGIYDCLEAEVTVSKTVDSATAIVGSLLTYDIAYQNLSDYIATNVIVTDTLPTGATLVSTSITPTTNIGGILTWNLGNILGHATGSIQVVLDTDDLSANTTVTNNASIASDNDINVENNSASADTTLQTPPPAPFVDVAISKSENTEYTTVGSDITYTLSYSNQGNTGSVNTIITDTLPAGSTYVSSSLEPTSIESGVVTWDINSLEADATGSITVVINTTGMEAGDITNTANINALCNADVVEKNFEEDIPSSDQATTPSDDQTTTSSDENTNQESVDTPTTDENTSAEQPTNETTDENTDDQDSNKDSQDVPQVQEDSAPTQEQPILCDENTENNTSSVTATIYIAPTVDLSIVKTASASSVVIGNTVTYTLSYSNLGNSSASNATITDTLPTGVQFVSSSVEPSLNASGTLMWELGEVEAGETGSIQVVVGTTGLPASTIVNNASIDSRCGEDDSMPEFMIPMKSKWSAACDENTGNDTSNVSISLQAAQTQGFGGGGGGSRSTTPGQLLETGGPSGTGSTGSGNDETPNTPRGEAYTFAHDNGITTMSSYLKARLDGGLLRGEAAKIIVAFYRNVLKKTITRIDACNPKNYADFADIDTETQGYIYDVCSIGVMGWKNDKSTILAKFRPYNYMTKAEFGAILSRLLYNTPSADQGQFRYLVHLNTLKNKAIIDSIDGPNNNELRGNVFQMLLKASKILQ